MRKITDEAVGAFLRGQSYKGSNTQTDGRSLWLHFNKIAEHRQDGLWITDCGWPTNVTGARLRALPGVNLSRKTVNGEKVWTLNGEQWDGTWRKVNDNVPPVVNDSVVGSLFDLTTKWVSSGGYRGSTQPVYAVCGANDTGTWSGSPCPSGVSEAEIRAAYNAIKAAGIPVKKVTHETSNVFCVAHYVVVPPRYVDKAREVVDKHLSEVSTRLLYAVS